MERYKPGLEDPNQRFTLSTKKAVTRLNGTAFSDSDGSIRQIGNDRVSPVSQPAISGKGILRQLWPENASFNKILFFVQCREPL